MKKFIVSLVMLFISFANSNAGELKSNKTFRIDFDENLTTYTCTVDYWDDNGVHSSFTGTSTTSMDKACEIAYKKIALNIMDH